jgi:hypothetical protein
MTLAIIELYQHDEVLRHYCDLLSDSGYNIKVFCSKVVYESLEEYTEGGRFEWYVNDEEASIPDFISENEGMIKEADLVFITTALSDFKAFYELSTKNKTLLLVHNARSFLAPNQNLAFREPILDRLRWLKLYFQGAHFYKKKMLESLTGVAFPTETILKYVKETFDLPAHLKLMSLPFAYAKKWEKLPADKITITIPCTVSSELRDYQSVAAAFQKIKNDLPNKIQVVLLGKPKGDGNKIIKSFKDLECDKLEVLSFKHFIAAPEYEKWLMVTDFLILPLKVYGRNHIYQELLGYSKISGGINDMIRFGIPALIPTHYSLDTTLKEISGRYLENELEVKIGKWISETPFLKLRNNKKGLLEKYDRIKMQQYFLKKINSLLNSV